MIPPALARTLPLVLSLLGCPKTPPPAAAAPETQLPRTPAAPLSDRPTESMRMTHPATNRCATATLGEWRYVRTVHYPNPVPDADLGFSYAGDRRNANVYLYPRLDGETLVDHLAQTAGHVPNAAWQPPSAAVDPATGITFATIVGTFQPDGSPTMPTMLLLGALDGYWFKVRASGGDDPNALPAIVDPLLAIVRMDCDGAPARVSRPSAR